MDELKEALIRGLQARNRLLLIHALIGLEVGLFIILTGGPGPVEHAFGPWARVALGLQAMIPGALILAAVAVSLGRRAGAWMALFGVLGLLVWQMTMTVIYAIQAFQDGAFVGLGEEMPPDAALAYVPWVYINLALLMVVHLIEIIYSTFYRNTASSSIHLGRPSH